MSDAALRMDKMYKWQTFIYDATRRPYLLGRDQLIEALSPPSGGRVLEIGCGTGRNLIHAKHKWPDATYYGFDVSDVMLHKARQEIARAKLGDSIMVAQGDATNFDPFAMFGVGQFDRIYFSYTLSMIPAWTMALDRAAGLVPPGGSLMVADFGDQAGLPGAFRTVLHTWLDMFDVTPRVELPAILRQVARRRDMRCDLTPLYKGYAFLAALRRPV